jgi:hypothetical protein
LGTATVLRWPALAPFVLSLRSTGFEGDIALLVEDKWLKADDYRSLAANQVQTIRIHQFLSRVPDRLRQLRFHRWLSVVHRYLPRMVAAIASNSKTRRRLFHNASAWFHPVMSERHFLYRNYLQSVGIVYSHVILSDVRDVIFQTNPDLWYSAAALNSFLEPPGVTLAGESHNAYWIRRLYGTSTLAAIGHHRVSCAGVVHGTLDGITTYLDASTAELSRHTTTVAGENGFDQGVHNFLLRSRGLEGVHVWENGEGLVLNMHGLSLNHGNVRSDGIVVDATGRVIPVLHQYDRHPELGRAILRKFDGPSQSQAPTA